MTVLAFFGANAEGWESRRDFWARLSILRYVISAGAMMWIVKGVLVGILFFIVGGTAYLWIRIRIGLYLFAHGHTHRTLVYYESTQLLHNPVFWITLLMAIAIGLWIVRARTHAV